MQFRFVLHLDTNTSITLAQICGVITCKTDCIAEEEDHEVVLVDMHLKEFE